MVSLRPLNPSQVARKTFERIAKTGPFGSPVTLNARQFSAFTTKLTAFAKSKPAKTAKLLIRTIKLWEQKKLIVKTNDRFSYGGKDEMATMSGKVIAAIHKADPNVVTPPPVIAAR